MSDVVFKSVRKVFRHRPALFNLVGRERTGETVALRGVSFSARGTEVIAVLGPNGSGKTTALKLISTMLLPDAGSVQVCGCCSQRDSGKVRRHVGIAVAAERSFFPRLSARENLDFFAALDEIPRRERSRRIDEVLGDTGLAEQADTLVMKFSSGMYQRLGLARALIKRPSVLLLDEPSRSLDAAATSYLWATIRAIAGHNTGQGTVVFLATHNFAEAAALASRVLLLNRGLLVEDRCLTGRESAEDLQSLYFQHTGERVCEEEPAAGAVLPVAGLRTGAAR
jgi:ABC-2 type transport system ATP-binding protein